MEKNKIANDHFLYMSVMDFCQGTKNGWHKSWCKGGDVQWMFSADMFPSNVPRFILHWTIHHFTNSMPGSSSMAFAIRYREHHLMARRRVTMDHGNMVKHSCNHSFFNAHCTGLLDVFARFLLKCKFWGGVRGSHCRYTRGECYWTSPNLWFWGKSSQGGGHRPNSPTSSGPKGLEFRPSWAVFWNKWLDYGLHDCR